MQNYKILPEYSKVLYSAYKDWFKHLISSPQKLTSTSLELQKTFSNLCNYMVNQYLNKDCPQCISSCPTDNRFKNNLWNEIAPFNFYSQLFLCNEHIINDISTNVPGTNPHHEHLVNFTLRQLMDTFSPSNFPWTNPVVIQASLEQGGINFINGYLNYLEDVTRYINKCPPAGTENFKVGKTLALTPGHVIYRNNLIELIQYTPTTDKVYAEPILIIPACIMKYYILDLSPYNSMVKFLVENGHTVFMVSWKNPDKNYRNLGLDDYINSGIIDALNVIKEIIPDNDIHCTGYCIGGTLLMLYAALMASDTKVKTLTLFASQVDFKDAGELLLFIDEEQIKSLEETMQVQGFLSGEQMASCFNMLHAKDLVWSRYIQDYMLGNRYPLSDMMAWNDDTTRLPAKMHSEYLRKLYLHNELSIGKFKIKGQTLSLKDIQKPMFVVSTLKDHIAPWKSVYKIHNLTDTDITYVLTQGGHNSGIVNEPGHLHANYQILQHKKSEMPLTAEEWQEKAANHEGSWWISWHKWLADFSNTKVSPPTIGNKIYKILCNAPGTYVTQS